MLIPHEYNYMVSNYNYRGDFEKSLYDLGGLTSLSLNYLSIFLDSVKSFNLILVILFLKFKFNYIVNLHKFINLYKIFLHLI